MESEDTSNVLQNVKVETIRCASTQRSLPNSINMVGKNCYHSIGCSKSNLHCQAGVLK